MEAFLGDFLLISELSMEMGVMFTQPGDPKKYYVILHQNNNSKCLERKIINGLGATLILSRRNTCELLAVRIQNKWNEEAVSV